MNEHIERMVKRLKTHIKDFPYIWLFFLFLFFGSMLALYGCWEFSKMVWLLAILLLIMLMLSKPMNAVYGLMGTTGSIRLFFFNFILITSVFAGIYYVGFFKDAGISYDVNQPHIDYNAYASGCVTKGILLSDSHVCKKIVNGDTITETIIQEIPVHYQHIGWSLVWRNTVLTALMQEPTEFFSIASTYNESIVDYKLSPKEKDKEIKLDKQKSMIFQWILIFQILISWIFFGVFISLLYNKFRYES